MADDFTSDKIAALLQGTGDNENDWGSRCNTETITPLATAIAGYLEKDVAGASDVTLTDDEAVNAFIKLTGAITADINVVVPAKEGGYFIWNATSGAFDVTVTTESGTGIIVLQDTRAHLWCDATNVVPVSAAQAFDAPTATGSSGNYTATPAEPKPTALRAGMPFAFKANHANTGAATLTWAGLTQKNLYLVGASGPAAMSGGEIQIGSIISGYYDGTQFVATAGVTNGALVPQTRKITAGVGLTGGGDLSADRAFAVVGGTGISVGTSVAIDKASTVQMKDPASSGINKVVTGDNMQFHPGVAKAWAKIQGSTGGVFIGYNVTNATVTRNSTGNYTVGWVTPFTSAHYVVDISGEGTTGDDVAVSQVVFGGQTASAVTIQFRNNSGGVFDPNSFFIVAYGDQ